MISIKLRDGSMHQIEDVEIRMLQDSYPHVAVEKEIKAAAAWCEANPSRRKTARGVRRFVNGWLARAKEAKPRTVAYAAAHKKFEPEKPKKINREVGQAGIQALKAAMRK